MNKKGTWSLTTIAKLALTLIILFFLILFAIKYYGSEAPTTKIINTQIGALGDYDNDKITNGFDKCPCTAVGSEEQAGLRGCPKGTTVDQAQDNQQKFKEQKCSEVGVRGETTPTPPRDTGKTVRGQNVMKESGWYTVDFGSPSGKYALTQNNELKWFDLSRSSWVTINPSDLEGARFKIELYEQLKTARTNPPQPITIRGIEVKKEGAWYTVDLGEESGKYALTENDVLQWFRASDGSWVDAEINNAIFIIEVYNGLQEAKNR